MPTKYKLNIERDVDTDEPGAFILNLPYGWRFSDEVVHVRGFDTMAELRVAVRQDVIVCGCAECVAGLQRNLDKHVP